MRFIIQAIFICMLSMISYSQIAQASLAPNSFNGYFKVGDCNLAHAAFATVKNISNEHNQDIIVVDFDDQQTSSLIINLDSKSFEIDVTLGLFSVTNNYYTKNANGGLLAIAQMRIGRSVTGNRVRINTKNLLDGEEKQCVLYRIQ
jgi:hypothetical protein